MEELAEPWQSAHDFDLLYHQFAQSWRIEPAGLAVLLPEGHEHCKLHRPRLSEPGAHRSVTDPNDRRCGGAGMQGRRCY